MKKLILTFAVIILFAGLASAQDVKPFNIYAGGGLGSPNGSDMFKDYWKMGYHGYAGLGFNFMPMMQIIGKAEYHMFSVDTDSDGELADVAEAAGDMTTFMFGGDVKLNPKAPFMPIKPFAIAGIGFASSSFSELNESSTDFYWNIGGGLELGGQGPLKFFAMARYVSISTEGESTTFIPVTLGIKF